MAVVVLVVGKPTQIFLDAAVQRIWLQCTVERYCIGQVVSAASTSLQRVVPVNARPRHNLTACIAPQASLPVVSSMRVPKYASQVSSSIFRVCVST